MRIVADEQLADVQPLFAALGELTLLPADALTPGAVKNADALLVRSVTKVDATLLAGSAVQFIGTATSGMDHLDLPYLRQRGIEVVHAAGSNANAVVDYCCCALACCFRLGLLSAEKPEKLRVGVIGAGHVGSALAGRLQALGFDVLCYDPPRAQAEAGFHSVSLADVLACDLISLHVPLTDSGEQATRGLINGPLLAQLAPGTVLLNTCRGGVVDEHALVEVLQRDQSLHYLADVWENEPDVSAELVRRSVLATPHVAGYSQRAKRRATQLLQEQFSSYFDLATSPATDSGQELSIETAETNGAESLTRDADYTSVWSLLEARLPLSALSTQFSEEVLAGRGSMAFKTLRNSMLSRREFCEMSLPVDGLADTLRQQASTMGFRLS